MKIHLTVALVVIYHMCCYGSAAQNEQCTVNPLSLSANDFGFELTKQIDGRGNMFISPFSIYTALALVHLGAGGKTAEQIQAAFQLRSTGNRFHEAFANLLKAIKSSNDEYSLFLANGLFAQREFPLKRTFIEEAKKFYDANVKEVDFQKKSEETKNEINAWVSGNTQNKIRDFLKEPLDPMTVLALLNAIYFKGIWKTQFNSADTADGLFYKNNGATTKVKHMMLRQVTFRYFEDRKNKYKFLELPYKGEHISMLLALPPSAEVAPNLEMTSDSLCYINSSLKPTKLEVVVLPKFKLDYRKELKEVLVGLGIKDLFTPSADLSGIREERDVFVSQVLHSAVIEVNEEGSEAAGVTGVFITRLSISTKPEFVANHPFLFYIIDNRNNLVLFSGRLADP